MTDNQLVTPTQVATFYQVSPRTVQRWAREGKLPSIKVGGVYRFSGKVLEYGDYEAIPS